MTNVVNFKEAKLAKIHRDLERLTREHEASREAEHWAALSVGFEFIPAGNDRWGCPIYGVAHDGHLLVEDRAEFSLDDALALVRELMDHRIPPAEYRRHAEDFVALMADMHAEADASIEADHE